MKIAHFTFNTYPEVVPELGKPIIVHLNNPESMSAPFILEKTTDDDLALQVYGYHNIGIHISDMPTFDWVYLSDIKPTLLN